MSDVSLKLIAKASEGSVRDSLSLLDRALVVQNISEKESEERLVRKMLGITDRSKILELLKFVFYGDHKKSIVVVREIINEGGEPVNLLNDILEMIHFILQKKMKHPQKIKLCDHSSTILNVIFRYERN